MKKQFIYSFIWIFLSFSTDLLGQEEVVWYEARGVEIDGNNLTKTAASGWNAGAASKNILPEGEDGWFEFTIAEVGKRFTVGLNDFNTSVAAGEIDFRFYLINGSRIYYYDNSKYKGNFVYAEGDKLKINRSNGILTFLKNEEVQYTSTEMHTAELIVDASILDSGAKIMDAKVSSSFNIPETLVRQGQNVIWTNEVTASKDFNTLIGTGRGSGGAASKNKLLKGKDGWVEMTVANTNTSRYFGLSEYNKNHNKATIDYALFLSHTGVLYAEEKGKRKAMLSNYYEGDILSIERIGKTINYLQNGRILYTAENESDSDLIVDVTLNKTATISNARTSFGVPQKETRGFPIVFENETGVTVSNNNLTKTANNGWNAGAASTNKLAAGKDGWIEMIAEESSRRVTFGLTQTNESLREADIDYGLRLYHNGTIYVMEKGASKGVYGHHYPEDIFSIEREDGTITYKKNGSTFYTSKTNSTEELIFDVTLYYKDATLSNARASFLYECDTDQDGDGICVEADCDDTNPTVPRDPKSECDDGDQNTVNDVIQADGCTCKGEIKDSTNIPNHGEIHSFFVPDDHDEDVNIRYSDGKVVIGNDSIVKPDGYRLFVEEGILTEEVVIALKNTNQWADYVFEKDYPLNNIKNVAGFIEKNKHLPNVPSAQEMVEKGLKVGEMNAILLRQIEELWLHLIEMEQRVEVLQQENNFMKSKSKINLGVSKE